MGLSGSPDRIEWQRCPVCEGRTWVPRGFYTGMTGAVDTNNAVCRRCNGEGTILPFEFPVSQRPGKRGEWAWIAAGLDEYHAVNLREALKLIPDTGDWHGSLRAACDIVLDDHPVAKPNQTAAQMLTRILRVPWANEVRDG